MRHANQIPDKKFHFNKKRTIFDYNLSKTMKITRFQYNIDYIHIITFREEYKLAVSPYFGFDKLRYAIDNENSINESIRLIFPIEHMAFFMRKEGFTFLFEGDLSELKNQNGVMKIFWDLFQNIKSFKGFKKCTKHTIIANAVDLMDKKEVDKILKKNPYFVKNPFGALTDFSCIYEFKKDDIACKFEFGNYSEEDLARYELRPFSTDYSKDLVGGSGQMFRVELNEDSKDPTFGKFKSLLYQTEQLIAKFISD